MVALPVDCARVYKPLRELGSGGFGTVWLAEHRELGREVALKVLHTAMLDEDDQRARFVNEARITAQLVDPHIVKVLDHGVGDVPWIAYEYLPGRSLRDILRSGPLPWREALQVAEQIAAALEAAHGQGVLHRDIKSDNVLEASAGHFKVADFGIAQWSGSEVRTRTGFVMGTPTHLAPEVWQGSPVSAASEVYALGVLLYELLIGKLPFDGENLRDILNAHLEKPPATPGRLQPDIPPELSELVKRALAKDPRDRFKSMSQMRIAIARVRNPPTPTEGTPAAAEPAPAASAAHGVSGVRSRREGLGSGTRTRPIGLGSGISNRTGSARRLTGSQSVVMPIAPPAPGRARWVALAIGLAAVAGGVLFALRLEPAPGPLPTASASPSPSATPAPRPSMDPTAALEALRSSSLVCSRAVSAGRQRTELALGLGVGTGFEITNPEEVFPKALAGIEGVARALKELDALDSGPIWGLVAAQVVEALRIVDYVPMRDRSARFVEALSAIRRVADHPTADPSRKVCGRAVRVRLDVLAKRDQALLIKAAEALESARLTLVALPPDHWVGLPVDRQYVFSRLAHLEVDVRETIVRGYAIYAPISTELDAARTAAVEHADELGRGLSPWPSGPWETELRGVLIDGVADALKLLKLNLPAGRLAEVVKRTRRLWLLITSRRLEPAEKARLEQRREELSKWVPGLY